MNVTPITMDPKVAKAKLDAYRQQLRRRSDDEYRAAVQGYKALAKGTRLISLMQAFQQAGLGADSRPRLAVARADRKEVRVERTIWRTPSGFTFSDPSSSRTAKGMTTLVAYPDPPQCKVGYALVPMVPADVRPNVALDKCLVLWEVEQWADRQVSVRPDRDPYLLKHIAGDLYAVLAEWDLTPLERAIMAEYRRAR